MSHQTFSPLNKLDDPGRGRAISGPAIPVNRRPGRDLVKGIGKVCFRTAHPN